MRTRMRTRMTGRTRRRSQTPTRQGLRRQRQSSRPTMRQMRASLPAGTNWSLRRAEHDWQPAASPPRSGGIDLAARPSPPPLPGARPRPHRQKAAQHRRRRPRTRGMTIAAMASVRRMRCRTRRPGLRLPRPLTPRRSARVAQLRLGMAPGAPRAAWATQRRAGRSRTSLWPSCARSVRPGARQLLAKRPQIRRRPRARARGAVRASARPHCAARRAARPQAARVPRSSAPSANLSLYLTRPTLSAWPLLASLTWASSSRGWGTTCSSSTSTLRTRSPTLSGCRRPPCSSASHCSLRCRWSSRRRRSWWSKPTRELFTTMASTLSRTPRRRRTSACG
mmetsp:Transcript_20430/g.63352  ORF Transcript_20430/g.63352 Transcript_20430/m.63352 type:complete len:337 (-) Transcript_20430:464-1474(-)